MLYWDKQVGIYMFDACWLADPRYWSITPEVRVKEMRPTGISCSSTKTDMDGDVECWDPAGGGPLCYLALLLMCRSSSHMHTSHVYHSFMLTWGRAVGANVSG
jgi:hypothetical protein